MIAIISDLHDNEPNINKVLNYCKTNNITALICCGDVSTEETLTYLSQNFAGQIWLCTGNMEIFDSQNPPRYKNMKFLGRNGGSFAYKNKIIGICHEPYLINPLIKNHPDVDVVFYGHTHKPWEEVREINSKNNINQQKYSTQQNKDQIKTIKIINPGNVSNTRFSATFATYDPQTDEPRLHLLDEM
jgi:putative phosphoesterase